SLGGDTLVDLVTDLIPSVLVILTFMTAVVRFVGDDKVEYLSKHLASKNFLVRHLILPFIAVFFFSSPAQFIAGKYLKEKHKAAYFEATNCLSMAPLMSFFPHVNAAEIFVYLGVASGVEQAGFSITPLAVSVLIIGIVTTTIRSILVEQVNRFLASRQGINWDEIEANKVV